MLIKRNENDITIKFDVENTIDEMKNVLKEYFSHMLNENRHCYCETSFFAYDFGIPLRFISLWPHLNEPLKMDIRDLPENLFDHYRYAIKWNNFETEFADLRGMLTIRMHTEKPASVSQLSLNSLEWANVLIEGCERALTEISGFVKFYL